MLKLVIIDLDDTIINYTEAHNIAFDILIQQITKYSTCDYATIIQKHKDVKSKLYNQYDKQFIRHDKLLQLKLLCNELHIRDTKIISELYNVYETTYIDNITIHNKCMYFLHLCRNNNIKVSIMTNNLLPIQLKVCNKLNLNELVDAIFTSNEFFYEKPHHECLHYILNYYGCTNDETLIIGDSIENDIKWGQTNDVKSILCDNKSEETSFQTCINYVESILTANG